jgi:hypothetical protein
MTSRCHAVLVLVAGAVSLALLACTRAQQRGRQKEDQAWDNYRKAIGADPQEAAKAEAARRHGRELRSAGGCKHAALRTSATPDADYALCRGESSSAPKAIHLAEFRAHYGGDLGSIRKHCSPIRAEIEKAMRDFHATHPAYAPFPPDSVGRFFRAWEVFCVDGEVY